MPKAKIPHFKLHSGIEVKFSKNPLHARVMYLELDDETYEYLAFDQGITSMQITASGSDQWFSTFITRLEEPLIHKEHIAAWLHPSKAKSS